MAAYLGDDCVIVQEGAALNEVKGGSDEPIPRVLGFSFGRALGLQPRREPRTGLLAPGTNGINLDPTEVEQARKVARTIKGVVTMAEARTASEVAQKAGRTDRARKLASWLGEIPGAKPGVPNRPNGSKALRQNRRRAQTNAGHRVRQSLEKAPGSAGSTSWRPRHRR